VQYTDLKEPSMTDTFAKFLPNFEAILDFHKANFEALVQVQAALIKGTQQISHEVIAQTQAQIDAASQVSKTALAAKSLQDVVQFQVGQAKSAYETLVAGSTKIGELSVQVANDAFAPIRARATHVSETLIKPLAA
jgi:phasin family protein